MCQFAQSTHEHATRANALVVSACFGADLHACYVVCLDYVFAIFAAAAAFF